MSIFIHFRQLLAIHVKYGWIKYVELPERSWAYRMAQDGASPWSKWPLTRDFNNLMIWLLAKDDCMQSSHTMSTNVNKHSNLRQTWPNTKAVKVVGCTLRQVHQKIWRIGRHCLTLPHNRPATNNQNAPSGNATFPPALRKPLEPTSPSQTPNIPSSTTIMIGDDELYSIPYALHCRQLWFNMRFTKTAEHINPFKKISSFTS